MKTKVFRAISIFIRTLAWIAWCFIFYQVITVVIFYFLAINHDGQIALDIPLEDEYKWIVALIGIVITGIFSWITIILKKFAIVKPYQNGTYNPRDGLLRYYLVLLTNWIIAHYIACFGASLYLGLNFPWILLLMVVLSAALLIIHNPRLGKFA